MLKCFSVGNKHTLFIMGFITLHICFINTINTLLINSLGVVAHASNPSFQEEDRRTN